MSVTVLVYRFAEGVKIRIPRVIVIVWQTILLRHDLYENVIWNKLEEILTGFIRIRLDLIYDLGSSNECNQNL